MNQYVNPRTKYAVISPLTTGLEENAFTLSTENSSRQRQAKLRQWHGGVCCVKSGSVGTFTISVFAVINSVEYQVDEVVLTAGQSATWTYEEYGLDLGPSDSVKMTVSQSGAQGSDRVYLFIRTRDVA
tara:strand:- start:1995 stop:2378 length:384 start_codon:yes stop_codon:yes gene_type:complete